MQNCIVVGNVGSIREIENSNRKVYMSIADHYVSKDENNNRVKKTRWVNVEGFLPTGLDIKVGQLVAVKFIVTSYKKKDGTWATANDIIDIDVTLNNMSKKNDEDEAAEEEDPAEEVPAKSGKKAAK